VTDEADSRLRDVATVIGVMRESKNAHVRVYAEELSRIVEYEDDMPAGFNRPITVNRATLIGVLRDMADAIEQDDSAGGFVEYEWSDEPDKMDVRARYRIGNASGQGGMRILHEPRDGSA
jgi:hypothetical protein